MHRGPTGIAYNPHRLLDTYPKLEKYIVKVLRDAGARIYYMSSTACSYKYLPVQQSSVEMLKSGGLRAGYPYDEAEHQSPADTVQH